MTIRKNEFLKKEYLYDFDVDGGSVGELTLKAADPNGNPLPEGFVVSKVSAVVEAAITPTAGEVTIGNSTDPNGYLDNIRASYNTLNSVVRSGEVAGVLLWDDTNDHAIDYRIDATADNQDIVMEIGTEAITAGKIRVIVEGHFPSSAAGY